MISYGRKSNIELLRIVSMLGIIAIHYFNSDMGSVATNASFPNMLWIFRQMLLSLTIPLVNCFILISGYFMIFKKNDNENKKICKLIFITAFYGFFSYFIYLIVCNESFSISKLFFSLIPFFSGKRWFVETYIILLLLIPYLNIMLKQISREKYFRLIVIQILLFSLWYSIGLSAPLLDDGYGIINFITLYLIGGYIRLYENDIQFLNKNKYFYLFGFLLVSLITFILSYFINPFGYAFITNIMGSVSIFIFFNKINIKENAFINKIASFSFDVYFIHSDPLTSSLLFQNILNTTMVTNVLILIPHMIFTLIFIYIIGIVFGFIRIHIFNFLNEIIHI